MLSCRIALRYLLSKKSHRVVNIISAIAVAGVAVATMATVVVLSVFNGFTQLSKNQLSHFDPDLLVTAVSGKTFAGGDSLAAVAESAEGVAAAAAILTDKAMLKSGYASIPIQFKAVDDNFGRVHDVDALLVQRAGEGLPDSADVALISVGVANRTALRSGDCAEIFVPRRKGRINVANPAASIRSAAIVAGGILESRQADIDNDLTVIPMTLGRRLLDYRNSEASAIEISLLPDATVSAVIERLRTHFGDDFDILDRRQQRETTFRMIEIEKWITFMMLVFILLIATFNILSTLSLLVIEKRGDAASLRALGYPRQSVASVFAWAGFIITVAGGMCGIIAGVLLSYVQQCFGIIRLSGDPAALTVDVYPVAVSGADICVVAVAVTVVAATVSLVTRLFTRNDFKTTK